MYFVVSIEGGGKQVSKTQIKSLDDARKFIDLKIVNTPYLQHQILDEKGKIISTDGKKNEVRRQYDRYPESTFEEEIGYLRREKEEILFNKLLLESADTKGKIKIEIRRKRAVQTECLGFLHYQLDSSDFGEYGMPMNVTTNVDEDSQDASQHLRSYRERENYNDVIELTAQAKSWSICREYKDGLPVLFIDITQPELWSFLRDKRFERNHDIYKDISKAEELTITETAVMRSVHQHKKIRPDYSQDSAAEFLLKIGLLKKVVGITERWELTEKGTKLHKEIANTR
jgi:hypothetical protein